MVGVYLQERTPCPALAATKLAEWIGENMQEELGFPDKADKRAQLGTGWTPAELNSILHERTAERAREWAAPAALANLGGGAAPMSIAAAHREASYMQMRSHAGLRDT